MTNKSETIKLDLRNAKDRQKFVQTLESCNGVITTACNIHHVSKATLYRYRKKYKTFGEAVNEAKGLQIDYAESKLFKLIEEKNVTAIIFFLKTRGRDRGYGEKYVPEREQEKPRPEQDKRAIRLLAETKEQIKEVLKNNGTYNDGLSYQIDLAAMLYTKLALMKSEIFDVNYHSVLIEQSREGNKREIANPMENLFRQYTSALQAALRGLGMNTDCKQKVVSDDGFADFYASMNEE